MIKQFTFNHFEVNTYLIVDEGWVPVLQKAGVKNYEQLKAANPNKLFNDLGGLRKKMKLDIPALKREQFDAWLNG